MINWMKMHKHGYGECRFCGGICKDEVSINEWDKAYVELEKARAAGDKTRVTYLVERISEYLTYADRR